MEQNLLPLVSKVIELKRDRQRSAFSTEAERNSYLGNLVSDFKGYDYSDEYESSVEYLEGFYRKVDPSSVEYGIVESLSFMLEVHKRNGQAGDLFQLSEDICINDSYKKDYFNRYFTHMFIYMLQRLGDVTKIKPDLLNLKEKKWTMDDNNILKTLMQERKDYQSISNAMNRSIYDIVNQMFKKKKLRNFEAVYLLSLYEVALNEPEFYHSIYTQFESFQLEWFIDRLFSF